MFSLILVSLLFVTLFSGCVRYKDGKPVEEKTASVEPEEEKPKEETKKEENKQPEVDQQATTDLKQYIDDSFSISASWYGLIESMEVVNDVVTVKTNVLGDNEGKKSVENIDNAIWGYTNTNDSKYHFKKVNILDKDGKVILSENNPLH